MMALTRVKTGMVSSLKQCVEIVLVAIAYHCRVWWVYAIPLRICSVPPMHLSLDILIGDWSVRRAKVSQSSSKTHTLKSCQRSTMEQKLKNESNCLETKTQLTRISKGLFEHKLWVFFWVWSSLSTSSAPPLKIHSHLSLCCPSLCGFLGQSHCAGCSHLNC